MSALQRQEPNHNKVLFILLFLIAMMVALVSFSVPLYKMFCQITGYGGTVQQVNLKDEIVILEREIKVSFNADVNKDLPWEFRPVQRSITVKIGEEALIFFKAKNLSDKPITGMAIFNVIPFKIGEYFNKVECFCFTEQTLQPGEEVDMPVTFYIDPEMAKDKRLDEIMEMTLSYSFFVSKDDDKD